MAFLKIKKVLGLVGQFPFLLPTTDTIGNYWSLWLYNHNQHFQKKKTEN